MISICTGWQRKFSKGYFRKYEDSILYACIQYQIAMRQEDLLDTCDSCCVIPDSINLIWWLLVMKIYWHLSLEPQFNFLLLNGSKWKLQTRLNLLCLSNATIFYVILMETKCKTAKKKKKKELPCHHISRLYKCDTWIKTPSRFSKKVKCFWIK